MNRTERAATLARSRRGDSRGSVDVKDVDQAMYREDAGFALTGAGYEKYKEDETGYQEEYSRVNEELTAAEKELAGFDISLEGEYKKYSDSFIPVRVVNEASTVSDIFGAVTGRDKRDPVEATYYLPRDVVDKLDSEAFNTEGSYTGNYVEDGVYNVDVRVSGTDDLRGKELHEALQDAQASVKAAFYETNAPGVSKARGQLAEARDTVLGERESLTNINDQREAQKATLADDYSKRKAHRQALFTPQN